MPAIFRNSAASTLAAQVQVNDTTISVTSGTGNRFPSPAANEWFFATIQSGASYEIVKCTSRAGDILTIARAQDGTSAQLWNAGASIDLRIPRIVLDSFVQYDASGNVGIGTATPLGRLQANASAPFGSAIVARSDTSAVNWARMDWSNHNVASPGIIYLDQTGNFVIRNDNAGPVMFMTGGGNERMRIDASGNVGIGTTTPTGKLHVGSDSGINVVKIAGGNSGADGGSALYCMQGGTVNVAFGNTSAILGTGYSADALLYSTGAARIYAGAQERFRIDLNGNVGIGTTTPSGRLQANASSAFGSAIVARSDTSAVNWARMDWSNHNVAPTGIIYLDQTGHFVIRNDNAAPVTFMTGGGNERMRIGPAGQLGLSGANYGGSGQVLTSSGPNAAPVWGSILTRRNKILNGSFDVWQLGTYFTVSAPLQKLADRWNFDCNGTRGNLIVQAGGRVDVASDLIVNNCARITNLGGASGNTFYDFSTQIEGVDTLQNKQVTISFYARSASGSNQIVVKTEQYFGGGGGSAPVFNTSAPITIAVGVWQRYSVTFQLALTAGKTLGGNGDNTLNVIFTLPLNTTFDLYLACVQIEEGATASPFEVPPYAETFEQCQRYLQTSYDNGFAPGMITSVGVLSFQAGGINPITTIQLKTPMRTVPFITYYNPVTGAVGTWDDGGTARTVTTNTNGTKNVVARVDGSFAGNFISGHYVLQDPYY